MLTDPSFYAVALPAVVLYGLSKGGFSGVGLLAIPLLSLVMSPVQAAAIMLPVLMVQDVVTIYNYRRTWDRRTLALMLPGACAGIVLAALTAAMVSLPQIRLAVGLLAIGFCLNAWFGPDLHGSASKPHDRLAATLLSTLAGYSSFVITAGGPLFNMYALSRLKDSSVFVGTSAMFFGLVNVIKVPPYVALGQFTYDNLLLSTVLIPVAIAGNLLGIWLVRRMPRELFFRVIYGLTFLIGCKLVVDALH